MGIATIEKDLEIFSKRISHTSLSVAALGQLDPIPKFQAVMAVGGRVSIVGGIGAANDMLPTIAVGQYKSHVRANRGGRHNRRVSIAALCVGADVGYLDG